MPNGTTNAAQGTGALIGRVLLSAIFIWSGYDKLISAAKTQAEFAHLNLPLPEAVWVLAVVVELIGGLALLVGFQTRLMGFVLGAWSIATAVVAHSDWSNHDMQIHFMKNVAMAGGFAFVIVFGGGAYSLDQVLGSSRRARARAHVNSLR
jgi:putative oxidoreductase